MSIADFVMRISEPDKIKIIRKTKIKTEISPAFMTCLNFYTLRSFRPTSTALRQAGN